MGQHQLLTDASEDDMVLADVGAAAQRRETDRTGRTWPGDAVAPARCYLVEFYAPRPGGGAAERQRRAGRSIDLGAMVHLHDFEVPIGPEPACHLINEAEQE